METISQTEVKNQSQDIDTGRVDRHTVETDERVGGSLLAQRVIYYVGGVILVLLAVRFVLLLLGASRASGFVSLIYTVSGVFVAPFSGIFERPAYGTSAFDTATLVAMVVYALLMVGLAKLVTINKVDRDAA